MPRIFFESGQNEAPDLVVSPDGAWAAALWGVNLYLYDLRTPPPAGAGTCSPVAEVACPEGTGRIVFLDAERLLHIFTEPATESEPLVISAEMLGVPSLQPVGPLARVAGAQRIVGVGPGGAVVAPNGPGADILHLRNGELMLQRTFIRGEVLSAIPAPERRFLLEQRGGFDLWDSATRGALSRLVLQTRQQAAQVGYVSGGRMLWALASGPPVHIEIFRASDGRRILELDQPGRGLAADAGPGRLLTAVEERTGLVFLDLEIATGALQRLPLPPSSGRLYSFAAGASSSSPEVVALTEAESPALLRMPLSRLQSPVSGEGNDSSGQAAQTESSAQRGRSLSREHTRGQTRELAPVVTQAARLRPQRPENRLFRRTPAQADSPAWPPPPAAPQQLPAAAAPEPELAAVARSDWPAVAASVSEPGRQPIQPPDRKQHPRYRAMLERVHEPSQGPAAWQWELLRWAANALLGSGGGTALSQPPNGGPLSKLGLRLGLTPRAQKLLALLYAAEYLLGTRPKGMRLPELIACLSASDEEPALLAELMPAAPLRSLGLLLMRPDGRLRIHRETAALLLGAPHPLLEPGARSDAEPLLPGVYVHAGPWRRGTMLLSPQPLVRLDALALPEAKLQPTLERALAAALLHDAGLLVDGLPGLSYPVWNSVAALCSLPALLRAPRVPVILCAAADAVPALAITAKPLPESAVAAASKLPAPLLPSAPLPCGARWRSPQPLAAAAFLGQGISRGRLERAVLDDRRAAIVISTAATAEACSRAAYLASRDGAVLLCEGELLSSFVQLLSILLARLPVLVAASSGQSPSAPWPAPLAEFAE